MSLIHFISSKFSQFGFVLVSDCTKLSNFDSNDFFLQMPATRGIWQPQIDKREMCHKRVAFKFVAFIFCCFFAFHSGEGFFQRLYC